jgi:two-component sensor histidine kinase
MDTSSSMAHFVAALDGRIRSMASTHELLSGRSWLGIPLSDLLGRELAPYMSNGNTGIRGPDVLLSAEASQTIALVFHELTTNAAKYGALSQRKGRVAVHWYHSRSGRAPGRLAIEWVEIGGPPARTPRKSGYGTAVITELVPYELGGTADLTFAPEGVRCRLEIPDKWVGTGRHTGPEPMVETTAAAATGSRAAVAVWPDSFARVDRRAAARSASASGHLSQRHRP